jgi:tetratricopeptide (TPR) repeat protein
MGQASGPRAERFAPGYDLKTGVDAKAAALAHVEAATRLIADVEGSIRANKLLKRALTAWQKGDAAETAKHALAATEAEENNAHAYHLLAIALEKLGFVHKALVTYERAFALDPDNTDLLLNLGLTAWSLGHLEGAERMFRHFIDRLPDHPAGYNNLGTVLRDRGSLADAIDCLRAAIYRMPQEPMLWNTLGTALAEEGRAEDSLVFYQEALRLNPNYARVWHNLGYSYMHLGRLEDARDAYDRALTLATHKAEKLEARHSRSICMLGMGRLREGFADYEVRHDPEFRASLIHYVKAPLWKGEMLKGKRVLLIGEQGLGDELMFANIVPDMVQAIGPEGRLQIAVDPRLISLFQRSFPQAEIGDYDDRKLDAKYVRIFEWARKDGDPDFYAPLGTPLSHFRQALESFPKRAFLTPDPIRTGEFRRRLGEIGPGPYVGLCWRSMVLGALRQKYFSALEAWAPILKTKGVTFVNLQYGDCTAELARAAKRIGVPIHDFADLNLKNDIDGAAALSAACDLVISAPTAAAALAGAIGTPLWFLVAGRVWPQLGTEEYPWYAQSRVFRPEAFGDWDGVMPKVAGALAEFAGGAAQRT